MPKRISRSTLRRSIPLWKRTAALRKRLRGHLKDARPVTKAFRDDLYEPKLGRIR
jgi:hypothetical protein